jgi:hypothetical protein
MLKAARMGDLGAQVNVGYMYDTGVGVKRNREGAIRWYKLAYRRGSGAAASNIGTIFRDERNHKKALYWFERAVALDDEDANLEIAKLYLGQLDDTPMAASYLKKVCRSKSVTRYSQERARRLLKRISKEARPSNRH